MVEIAESDQALELSFIDWRRPRQMWVFPLEKLFMMEGKFKVIFDILCIRQHPYCIGVTSFEKAAFFNESSLARRRGLLRDIKSIISDS
jgi:hypothetical protein